MLPESIPIEVKYEDEYLLVVDKPAGLVVHPAAGNFDGTLVNALLHQARASCPESAASLAFNRRQTLWMIIVPQCVKRMLPPQRVPSQLNV